MKKIKRWQWLVLVTSFIQLITPGIITVLGYTVEGQTSSPQITPAGYAFIVWGVITLLSFGYGVFQALPNRSNQLLHYRLSTGLIVVYLLFACWLVAAILQWLAVTVMIFIVMFGVLTLLFQRVIDERERLLPIERVLLFGQLAIYAGWTTVAIFANTASALKFYGIDDSGISGIAWQSVILLLALLNGKYWLRKFNRNMVYGLTLIWALTGVFFGLLDYNDNLPLRIITLSGITLVGVHLVFRKSMVRQRA